MRHARDSKSRRLTLTRKGDISTLVRVESPDDAEFAEPLAPGDPETLARIDNPDDKDIHPGKRRSKRP